jgi:hypothetical protein
MLRYFTNIFICLIGFCGLSQVNEPVDLNPKDSVQYKQEYGLRVGLDLSRPARSLYEEGYTGLEIVADYRLKEKLFVAVELGNEERTDTEGIGSTALFNYTTSGSYIKLGADYNTYKNWYGEQNFITIGGRYAFSSFSQTLNNFRIFDSSRFFTDDFPETVTASEEFDGLTASWLELVLGTKIELFNNIYAGISVRLAFLITGRDGDERFPNLWIPGFNKVTDGSSFGIGYNYSISYFIPLYKKAKKKREDSGEKPK